ncbi:MAG: VCBS repeat-containing protein [Acidobacteria bacterium]|nr:VCBS repeat-containing protein [Acidobacteriota bacterium]
MLGILVLCPALVQGQTTITVNTLLDPPDSDIDPGDNVMSLREAIQTRNGMGEPVQIIFAEELANSGVLLLSRPLPALKIPETLIVGLTNDTFTDLEKRLLIRIFLIHPVYSADTPGEPILTIQSSGNTLKHLVFGGRNSIGVLLNGPDAHHNAVAGCLFGLSVLSGFGEDKIQLRHGVYLANGASDNTIGEAVTLGGNAFVNCKDTGIFVASPTCEFNRFQRNVLGSTELLNPAQTTPNGTGIRIRGKHTMVGGSTLSERNIIIGNRFSGVLVEGKEAVGNVISHNSIFGNGALGVDLSLIGGYGDGPNRYSNMEFRAGPNQLMPAPILYDYTHERLFNVHRFTLHGVTMPQALVEVYEADPDPSGYGEGMLFLGETVAADDGEFTVPFIMDPGHAVTLLATAEGNTSEFSQTILLQEVSGTQPVLQLQAWQNHFLLPRGEVRGFGINTNDRVSEDLTINHAFDPVGIAQFIDTTIIRDGNHLVAHLQGLNRGGTLLTLKVPPEYGGAQADSRIYVDEATEITVNVPAELEDQLAGLIPYNYYRFAASAGEILNVTVESLPDAEGNLRLDPVVHVFSGFPRTLAFNNNYRGVDSYVQFIVPESGVYFLAVADLYLRSGQDYRFRLRAWIDRRQESFAPDRPPDQVDLAHVPDRVARGDLDNDGYDDLIVTLAGVPQIAVLLKDPRPGMNFRPPLMVNIGFAAHDITIQDFDNDGRVDLLLTDPVTGNVFILFNTGQFGKSAAGKSIMATGKSSLFSVPAGEGEGTSSDFNKDTFTDYAFLSNSEQTLQIYLNDGSGNLSLNQVLAAGSGPVTMATADFNGDQAPDIAVVDGTDSLVRVFRGMGDGDFEAASTLITAASPTDLKATDLNDDGLADILVCTDGEGLLHTFSALTSFEFELYQDLPAGTNPTSIAVADLNADGFEDVAVANGGSQDIYIYQGVQQGLLIPAAVLTETGEVEELLWLSFGNGGGYIGISPDTEFVSLLKGNYRILDFPNSETSTEVAAAFALANPAGGGEALVYFSLYDEDGSLVADPDVENPVALTIPEGEQIAFYVTDIFGSGINAYHPWMRAVSLSPRLQGFYLLTSVTAGPFMDGAVAQEVPAVITILPTNESLTTDGDCQVSIVNPNDATARVTVACIGTDGSGLADPFQTTLAPGGRLSFPFSDMFPGVTGACYLEVSADRPLDCFQYGGTDNLMTAAPGVVLTEPDKTASRLYAPHFAEGRFYRSVLELYNRSANPAEIVISAFRDDGTPFRTSAPAMIPPGGMRREELSQLLDIDWQSVDYEVGFLQVDSDQSGLGGTLTFGDRAQASFAATLVLQAGGLNRMMFSHLAYGELYGTDYFTGLTLLNAGANDAVAHFEVFDEFGNLTGAGDVPILAGTKSSRMLADFVPGLLPQIKGYITITTSDPAARLVAFELFGDMAGTFMSAVPPQSFSEEIAR